MKRDLKQTIVYLAVVATLWTAAIALIVMASGCSHGQVVKERAPDGIVMQEEAGSHVAEILEGLTGQRPYAVTIPGLPPVYFGTPAPCLRVHEETHVAQIARDGAATFDLRYLDQFIRCMVGHPEMDRKASFPWCERNGIEYEREAYDAMDACMKAGGVSLEDLVPKISIGRLVFRAADLKGGE